jgi:putative ABC transport system permease protein
VPNSDRDRTRTCDPVINSHLLYQLSYAARTLKLSGRGGPFKARITRNKGPARPYFPPMRSSVAVGLDALRANPMRTLLSTLGIVMGVGAMVSVLAMGDGVERFARQQLEQTTDLLAVTVTARASTRVDGIEVRRTDILQFRSADALALASAVEGEDKIGLISTGASLATVGTEATPRGFSVMGTLGRYAADRGLVLASGRWFTDSDTAVVVLSHGAALAVVGNAAAPDSVAQQAVGVTLTLNGNPHRVIGVLGALPAESGLAAWVPVDDASRAIAGARIPQMFVTAARVEDVDTLRANVERWAGSSFGPSWRDRVSVSTNRARVAQAAVGMRVFKILMGAITGVSLLVGGIGIMNVLLAAVAERTREIGIRKATGARFRDILLQFLAESVTIAGVGALVGVALGLGIAFTVAEVMRRQTNALIFVAITPSTILFASGAAVAVGLVFGIYPALRAARLSPIDAIRHE